MTVTMKRNILIFLCLFGSLQLFAQQEIQVSQYMFSGIYLNPGYAGTHDFTEASAIYRNQWTGFPGAPTTELFSLEGQIAQGIMGLGMTITNDKIGDTRQTQFSGIYSYKLLLNSSGDLKLSFGIKATLADYSAKLTETKVWDSGDPVFSQDQVDRLIPKFGAGVYIYSKVWYAGLAIPTLYAADKKITYDLNGLDHNFFKKHYYLNAGYVFNAGTNFKIKPSFLLKFQSAAPLTADINCNVLYQNRIWLGVSYRTQDAIVGMLEYEITPNLRAGYSYDLTTSAIRNYSGGSHEIQVAYQFVNKQVKTRTPRYF